jgi:hypothetical protein
MATKARRRDLARYWPAIILLFAGFVALIAFPFVQPGTPCVCSGPPGTACNCPSVPAHPVPLYLVGPLLLLAAGVYSLAVFLNGLYRHGKSQPPADSSIWA